MLDLEPRPLGEPNWLDRLLGRRPKSDAAAAIWNLLATHEPAELSGAKLAEVLAEYRVRHHDVQGLLRTVYRELLEYCSQDQHISDQEEEALMAIRRSFNLSNLDILAIEREVHSRHTAEFIQGAVADEHLSDHERERLASLVRSLRLSDSLVDGLRREALEPLLQRRFDAALSDRRLAPDEEAELAALAANLGVALRYDGATERRLEHFRLLWRIEQGELPVLATDIRLQRGESCHGHLPATHFEFRTVTRAVSYHGPTARIRIMRGVHWKLGHVELTRHTAEVRKSLGTGTLYLTNKRLIFNGPGKTTNIRLNRIIEFTVMGDGLQIQKDAGRDQFFGCQGDELELFGVTLGALLRHSDV